MAADAKFVIKAKDETGPATKSAKGNFKSLEESIKGTARVMELAGQAARVTAFAFGAAGLVRSLRATIEQGAKMNALFATAQADMVAFKASTDRLKVGFAEGLVPAMSLATEALTKLQDELDRRGEGSRTFAMDTAIATFLANLTGLTPAVGILLKQLQEKRREMEAAGAATMGAAEDLKAFETMCKAAGAELDRSRTPLEQYRDRLQQVAFWVQKGALLEQQATGIRRSYLAELLRANPLPKTPAPDTSLIAVPRNSALVEPAAGLAGFNFDRIIGPQMAVVQRAQAELVTRWDVMWATMRDSAAEALKGTTDALADALFDWKNGLTILRDFATDVLKQISAALLQRYITGPILSALHLEARAAGGPVSSGSAYIVGERGPELFLPGQSGAIIPNAALAGAGGPVNVTFNITAWDGRSVVETLAAHEGTIAALVQGRYNRRGRTGGPLR